MIYRGPIALALLILNAGVARRYLNKFMRPALLIGVALVCTVLFALIHASYGALNVALAGGFGTVAALTTIKYRSLLPGLLIHACYNAIATFL